MTTTDLIKAFKQGGTGNCVSVAVIKAAIEIFGLYRVFDTEQHEDGLLHVFMRDGASFTLTAEELAYASENSRFELLQNQEVFDYALLCYAVIAKRLQQDEHEGKFTYAEAIADLNDGANYLQGPNWLGLRHYVRAVGLKFVKQYAGVIGASPRHCFFTSYKLADDYGSVDPIRWYEVKYNFYHYFSLDSTPIY